MYIDDLLCLDQDPLRLARSMALALELFQKELGLQIKVSKAQWSPSQDFTCLGLIWNTVTMQVRVPPQGNQGDPAVRQPPFDGLTSRTSSGHKGSRQVRWASDVMLPSNPPSQAASALPATRIGESGQTRRMERRSSSLQARPRRSGVVAYQCSVGVERSSYRRAPASASNVSED